jgi:hypothetical protein
MVIVFFAPPVIHHWPMAALFGLLIGGAAPTLDRYPKFFYASASITALYTLAVWVLSPLTVVRSIDYSAVVFLMGSLFGLAYLYRSAALPIKSA